MKKSDVVLDVGTFPVLLSFSHKFVLYDDTCPVSSIISIAFAAVSVSEDEGS